MNQINSGEAERKTRERLISPVPLHIFLLEIWMFTAYVQRAAGKFLQGDLCERNVN